MSTGDRDPLYAYNDAQAERTYTQDELDTAVAAERERCAKVCEAQDESNLELRYEYRRAALDCADAIRGA